MLFFFSDRTFVTERMENSEGPASAGPHGRTPAVDDVSQGQNIGHYEGVVVGNGCCSFVLVLSIWYTHCCL